MEQMKYLETRDSYMHALMAPMREAREKHYGERWLTHHVTAYHSGREGMVQALVGLADVAARHEARFDSPIGSDYVLGAAWETMLRGWRALLNGELGLLDGGMCDRQARALCKRAGFEGEL